MIIQTGMRTDIPAFYSKWFKNRLQEGYVLVRNPYNPQPVTKYILKPSVVDMIGFCTKNPAPMLNDPECMRLLSPFGQYWFVTITPYGKDIEAFRAMAEILSGYTRTAVISFIMIYGKLRVNYPEAAAVPMESRIRITKAFVEIGAEYGLTIKPCGDNRGLENTGADLSGCMTVKTFETAIGKNLKCPPNPKSPFLIGNS